MWRKYQGMVEGKAEGQAVLVCQTASGGVFRVRCKGTDEYRRYQWEHQPIFIGAMLTVRYQNLSDDGIPVFPVGIAVRDYES